MNDNTAYAEDFAVDFLDVVLVFWEELIAVVQSSKALSVRAGFNSARAKLVEKFQNPRFRQNHFHTFRHFRATMEYAKDRDILRVQQMLGHKRIENIEIYTHLIDFAPEEYTIRRPRTSKEEDELLEAGFQFVRFDEKDQCPIYRKRK